MVFIPQTGPTDGIRMVEIVVLRAVGIMSTYMKELVDQKAVRRHRYVVNVPVSAFVFVLGSVVVRVEETWVAIFP
jgi:hypothetical protein